MRACTKNLFHALDSDSASVLEIPPTHCYRNGWNGLDTFAVRRWRALAVKSLGTSYSQNKWYFATAAHGILTYFPTYLRQSERAKEKESSNGQILPFLGNIFPKKQF